MTRRRWIAEHWDEATATLVGAQAEHLARVLRAHVGTEADVVAGGHVFHARVAALSNHEVRFNLIAEVQADLPGVIVWDPLWTFRHGNTISAFEGSRPLFLDGDHLSNYGGARLYPSFKAVLEKIWP